MPRFTEQEYREILLARERWANDKNNVRRYPSYPSEAEPQPLPQSLETLSQPLALLMARITNLEQQLPLLYKRLPNPKQRIKRQHFKGI